MALSPVTRHLALLGPLMSLSGCTHDVELLSSVSGSVPSYAGGALGFGAADGAGGQAVEQGGTDAGMGIPLGTGGVVLGTGGVVLGTGAVGSGGVPDTSVGGAAGVPFAGGGTAGSGGDLSGGAGNAGGEPGDAANSSGAGGAPQAGAMGACQGACSSPCTTDGECALGAEWCEGGACVACSARVPTCDLGWSPKGFARNGCTEFVCAPPSGCHSTADCSGGKVCYPGVLCAAGCSGDPSCCEGNFCALSGCEASSVPLPCSDIGCSLGSSCVGPAWSPPDCDCAAGAWSCTTPPTSSHCQ